MTFSYTQTPSYKKRARVGCRRRLWVVMVAMSGGNRNANKWKQSLFLLGELMHFSGTETI